MDALSSGIKVAEKTFWQFSPSYFFDKLIIDLTLEKIRLTEAEFKPLLNKCSLKVAASDGLRFSIIEVDELSFKYLIDRLANWKKVFLRSLPFNFKYNFKASSILYEDGFDE